MGNITIGVAIIFTTLIILLLTAGIIITIFIANKQRIQREVAYEKELRTVENEVQEQVLMNVSRELHDNIGQLLTFLHLQIERYKLDIPTSATVLAPIEDTLSTTVNEVRALGRSLNNEMLAQNGLLKSIQQEVERLQQLKNMAIILNTDGVEPDLNKDRKIMAFRIFQEIVNNALKHSGAHNIEIKLLGTPAFQLSVTDDGKGFDSEKILNNDSGMGLRNIVKRAELAQFKCEIFASDGKGCNFKLHSM